MTPNYPCPLDNKHCASIDRGLAALSQAVKLAEDCVDCGLPFTDTVAELRAKQTLLERLKAKFFPNAL